MRSFWGEILREPQSTEKTKTQTLQKGEAVASTASANSKYSPAPSQVNIKLHTRSLLP